MTESQIIIQPAASRVIQGTRQQIAAALEKLDPAEELTLIIPGLETEGTPRAAELSFDDVFGPLQKGFEASGMSEEALGEFVDAEIADYRAERRAKETVSHD